MKSRATKSAIRPGEYNNTAEKKLQNRKVFDWQHLRRGLIVFAAARPDLQGLYQLPYYPPGGLARAARHLSRSVAVAEQGANRNRPSATWSCSASARSAARMSTRLDKSIVRPQWPPEYGTADHKHFPAMSVDARKGIRRLALVLLPGPDARGCVLGGSMRLRLGASMTCGSFGKQFRSIFPETGWIANFLTRKILVGTDGAGSCLPSIAVTRSAQSTSTGATSRISLSQIEAPQRKRSGSRSGSPAPRLRSR